MRDRYWEEEESICATSEVNVFRYFPQAMRLQVCLPDWIDENGIQKQGKTVPINLTKLRNTKSTLEFLKDVLNDLG
jgi:predicted transcriptional regulator